MVYLSKIVTKNGDSGRTTLGDGSEVDKNNIIIKAIGDIEELNCQIGVLITFIFDQQDITAVLSKIQNDLFDLVADLCVPINKPNKLRISRKYIERLEKEINKFNEPLQPLNSFILPGGIPASANCHLARAICRRAERSVWELEFFNSEIAIYLNRLSDLLFIFARILTLNVPLWKPGNNDDQRIE
jgi:cob(I)alamin adenosyltransferase